MKYFIPALILLLVFGACKENLTEEVAEKYPDGSPKILRYYKGDGEDREMVRECTFHPNHNKYMDGEFKNNKKHGKWTSWYENGNKWSEGYFREGLDHGKRTGWHESGQLYFEGQYDKGKKTGVWKFWDEKGNLASQIDYDKK